MNRVEVVNLFLFLTFAIAALCAVAFLSFLGFVVIALLKGVGLV